MKTPPNPNADKRRTAYLKSMERRGHRAQIVQAEGDSWDFEEIGYREGLHAISKKRFSTDTVLCSNDRLAIGFLAAAYEMGIRIGRGRGGALRVAGHDDHPFSRFTCPPLTTVSQDYASIAELSVETLLKLIHSGGRDPPHATTLFEGRLVMRESA